MAFIHSSSMCVRMRMCVYIGGGGRMKEEESIIESFRACRIRI